MIEYRVRGREVHVGKRRIEKLRLFPSNCYRSAHLNLGGRGKEWTLGNLKHDNLSRNPV